MQFVDTHGHVHFDELAADAAKVLERAKKAGVEKIICPGVSLEDSERAIEFASRHENIWASAGVHPHEAKGFNEASKNMLGKLLNMLRIVACGEIGLDYYKLYSTKKEQQSALRAQIEIGQAANLPFIFHTRDAWSDFWQIMDSYQNIKGVIHSFTGGPKQLHEALGRNLYIALNGIITYTKDQALLEAAKIVPLNKLVLETDAPFLLPAGSQNKVCEPADLKITAKFLAELRQESQEKIAIATTKNAVELFGLN